MKGRWSVTGWVVAALFASLWLAAPKDLEVNAAGPGVEAIRTVKRVGMVIGLDEASMGEYKRLHADGYAGPGVRDLLNKYHMHNFSIFLHQIEGKWYEFGYYEYTGNDFEGDMAQLAKEPRNIAWLKVCDAMQIPLEGEDSWAEMEMVFLND
ncbi:MAG: L-rhamnose mutarotase [Candidatus Hydrogenedentes bacterium]|nr:L-rhamnose mutarotase [Candidatus Hydrogenedentota bacterium]